MSLMLKRREAILKQIRALSPGRTVTLIAVSKGQPVHAIEELLEAGQRDFGENRVQEAQLKWPALKARYSGVTLHLIGSLQSNKVREALSLFDVVHTIDRTSVVDALAKEKTTSCEFFIQVNTGEEPQKGGVAPNDLPALMRYITSTSLPVSGLMCIPPADEPPAPHFAFLRETAKTLGLSQLSMGMSGDYETAIRLGATHVRIGTALFGERA